MTRHPTFVAVPAVVVLLACVGCGGGGGYGAPTTPTAPTGQAATTSPADVSIAIVADAGAQSFNPNPSSVRMGQTVAWRNADGITHHIVQDNADTSSGGSGGYGPADGGGNASGFDGGSEGPGAVSSMLTARTVGTMHYHCTIHPGMVGTLTVTQ